MMKSSSPSASRLCSLLAAATLVLCGCSSNSKPTTAQGKALSNTDEQIFVGDTIEKNYDPHVIIKRAEAFFDKDEYAEAAIELTHFMELHRAHALAPYAQFRLGEAYLKQARTIDRDPEPVQKAMAAFEKLRSDYPANAYDSQAVARIHDCKDWLAQTHMFVGQFYYRREAYLAAAPRFEAILKDYPEMNVAPDALYYLALGLSNWAIARKCSLSLRGVESRLATLYEKLFVSVAEGTDQEAYEKLAYNIRTRAFFEALRRGLLNSDELEKASTDLEAWLQKDQKRFNEEQKRELASKKK